MNQYLTKQPNGMCDSSSLREMTAEEVGAVSGGMIPLVLIFAYGFTSGAGAMGLGLWLGSGR